ncbi:hypothetical protein Cfor_08903 [Coptotermes formosanus]|uniref:EF-hand domain-containing protein n=1 Tax=Coptotermes formosanus TaxID=36987 RepID=A0A6L2Q7H3_COPFO|nr:hypothetical protein Cfor_08903 [Coptotermes formosanus]
MATVINTENMQCLVSWPEHNTTIMQNTNGTGKVKKVKTQEGTKKCHCHRFSHWRPEQFNAGVEDDEGLGSPVVRYRPDNLDDITAATKFSKDEIRWVYRAFKQECPSGAINELTFKNIYAKFFPLGDSSQYAHYVFAALDREQSGTITFRDFMLGLSIVMKGTLQERLRWAFSLYDVNHDGYVTRAEMLAVISAIYDLMGDSGNAADHCPELHVNKIFKKLDLNNDGVITVDEFINYCSMWSGPCVIVHTKFVKYYDIIKSRNTDHRSNVERTKMDNMQVTSVRQEIVNFNLRIKALIQDIYTCQGPLEVLNELNREGRIKIANLRKQIEQLEILAKEQVKGTERTKLLAEVESHRQQLTSTYGAFRKANITCMLTIEKVNNKELFHDESEEATVRHRQRKDKEGLVKMSSDVTEQLLSISRHLAETSQHSADTLETLVNSSSNVQGIQDELQTTGSVITQSGKLLAKYGRRSCRTSFMNLPHSPVCFCHSAFPSFHRSHRPVLFTSYHYSKGPLSFMSLPVCGFVSFTSLQLVCVTCKSQLEGKWCMTWVLVTAPSFAVIIFLLAAAGFSTAIDIGQLICPRIPCTLIQSQCSVTNASDCGAGEKYVSHRQWCGCCSANCCGACVTGVGLHLRQSDYTFYEIKNNFRYKDCRLLESGAIIIHRKFISNNALGMKERVTLRLPWLRVTSHLGSHGHDKDCEKLGSL